MTEICITIWLDQTSDPVAAKSNSTTHLSLCKIDPYLVTFRDSNKCIDYITNLKEKECNVLLIISNETPCLSVDVLLQLSEELPQIDAVYILNSNETAEEIFETSGKQHGRVHTELKSLCNQLYQIPNIQRHRREGTTSNDFCVSSFCRLADSSTYTATTASDLLTVWSSSAKNIRERQEAEFLYAQFLRDILTDIESTEAEMIKFCRQKCADNERDLNVIDEFETYYDACNAIFWYTRDTFLYRLLNKALREQDIDTLYSLRYFIKDLHLQLKNRYASQNTSENSATTNDDASSTTDTVYRGQLMNNDEFDKKIRHNSGGFFSVCSFLSTTIHKNLARVYAGSSGNADGFQSVLFQIDINKTVNKFPYANISKESVFEEEENEILFTMGAVFRIQSIDLTEQGFWNINLLLSGEEDDELRTLSEYMKGDVFREIPLHSLAKLMLEMANYEKAEQYYLLTLQESSITEDFRWLSSVYNDLGILYDETGQQNKAIDYYEKAVKIKLENLPSNHPVFAGSYNNLGLVYQENGNYEKALSYFNQALNIEQNAVVPRTKLLASLFNNIGLVYDAQQHFPEALNMYQKCLQIQLKILPRNHPLLATSCNNIASIYFTQGNSDKAIEYFMKALDIQNLSLQPDHLLIARTCANLGKALYRQEKLKEALEYIKKAYEIYSKHFSATHPQVTDTRKWIGDIEEELSWHDAQDI